MSELLLEARRLVKHFPLTGGVWGREQKRVHAVNGVDLAIARGEVVGLVGESGCGKTTLGKTVVRLLEPTSGTIHFGGEEITHLSPKALAPFRRRMQIIFQDPYGSLNPRLTVRSILSEAVRFHGIVASDQVASHLEELLLHVGLTADVLGKYPHEFSGGQRQRIGIARALSVGPELIVADEPVSALDVSIQAQILNLLSDLRRELSLTFLFISHDLGVVEHFCDRVLIMYLGRVVESLPSDGLRQKVRHPYAKALLSAIPTIDPEKKERQLLKGDVPSPLALPAGCVFHTRCPLAEERCRSSVPQLAALNEEDHLLACPVVAA